jgi:hypothetical protein
VEGEAIDFNADTMPRLNPLALCGDFMARGDLEYPPCECNGYGLGWVLGWLGIGDERGGDQRRVRDIPEVWRLDIWEEERRV